GFEPGEVGLGEDEGAVVEDFDFEGVGGVADVFGEGFEVGDVDDADGFVAFVFVAVVEDFEGFGGVFGCGDAFDDGLHDGVGGGCVDGGVEGGDASEGGLGVGVAGAFVYGAQVLAGHLDGDAGGVAVFHD